MPMADGTVGIDPGLHPQPPSEEELAKEEEARSEVSLADLVELDLDDPTTPSRRMANREPQPGSFDVPLREWSRKPEGAIDGR